MQLLMLILTLEMGISALALKLIESISPPIMGTYFVCQIIFLSVNLSTKNKE